MDEATAHKVRDLKLKILHAEKELQATQHNANLGQWLHAGHTAQMAKANDRERERLEAKLADLKSKLDALTGGDSAPAPEPVAAETEPKPAKKAAATKAAAAPKTPAKKTAKK